MLVTKFTLGGKVEKKEGEKNHNKKKRRFGVFFRGLLWTGGVQPQHSPW